MNTIREDLPESVKETLTNLREYLNTDLYFYGSVTRSDYLHNQSDIDIAIFTDNEYSIKTKLQHFLKADRNAFDKVVWKLKNKMIYGYKIKCDKYIEINCEIAIYNNDFKDILLSNFVEASFGLPLYIRFLLFLVKTFYYVIPILSSKTYKKLKFIIFENILRDKGNSLFYLLKNKSNIYL